MKFCDRVQAGLVASVLAAAAFVLAGCGGGGGASLAAAGPSGGISGSGNSVGKISGFGSVIVNGRRFDTAGAMIIVDGSSSTQSELRVGQVVVVTADFDNLKASRVEYLAQIKGPVQALTVVDATLGTATLTVLGQSVATDAATNFEGARLDPASANALAVGDLVEVSGIRDANGVLVASYLEVKPEFAEYQVVGRATDVTATTFRIGALTVDYAATGATPRSGNTVEVKGLAADFNGGANSLVASKVEVVGGLPLSPGAAVEIEGYVTRFVSPSDFDVNGVRTTTNASTTYEHGGVANLGLNAKIEVEGRVNTSGAVLADRIEIKATGSVRIEGNVEAISTALQRLTVLGVPFSVRPETDLTDNSDLDVDPLQFSDIGVGDRVEMRGFLEGTAVVASELHRENDESGAKLRGRVTAKNAAAGQVTILGVTISGGTGTQYEGATGAAAFFNAVQVGDFVSAEWEDFVSTGTPADRLSLEED